MICNITSLRKAVTNITTFGEKPKMRPKYYKYYKNITRL